MKRVRKYKGKFIIEGFRQRLALVESDDEAAEVILSWLKNYLNHGQEILEVIKKDYPSYEKYYHKYAVLI